MRVGLQVIRFDWPGAPENTGRRLKEIATTAEEAGFYSLWVMDHLFQIGFSGPPEDPMLEGYSAISYMAAVTERVKLGLLVGAVTYRHPGLLVKCATTLDVLSGGRAYLGLGAAWFQREAEGLGLPFPPLSERYERLEETLQIATNMWAGDFSPYKGTHYHLAEPVNSPQPLSKPHPPIMIGGSGPRKTLRLVAQYADACNIGGGHTGRDDLRKVADGARQHLRILRGHCEDVGRPYERIERTALATTLIAPDAHTVDDVIEHCRLMADAGIEHLILNMSNVHEIAPLGVFGDKIIPVVQSM